MPTLDGRMRGSVEKVVLDARTASETAARVVLDALAVSRDAPFSAMDGLARDLRVALRARARALGNGVLVDGLDLLVDEIAYEQWHRMLFARFLAENSLLMHPSGLPVTLDDCAELAAEENEPDGWGVAAKYAEAMLPGIFRNDDPAVKVRLAPEGRAALETKLRELPHTLFTAEDGMGWVYQFWQSARKDQVNASGHKVGGADLAPVTQLFTEDYMVRFLLKNTLGAWWASRHPLSPLIAELIYLRRREDGSPAAGTFSHWPERTALLTIMDPCCGSGHFLEAAFRLLVRMRMEEEGLGKGEAGDVVLRDNLFGLELDPRCVQIAAFQLALSAWRLDGYRTLPSLNLACSGVAVRGQLDEWLSLAKGDPNLGLTLRSLHALFQQAPDLGSLVNPLHADLDNRLFGVKHEDVALLLEAALHREGADPAAVVFGASAEGASRAARLLGRTYTLVTTNVPYLTRNKQDEALMAFCDRYYRDGKADLATAFIERCVAFADGSGTMALVTPQNWLFQSAYQGMRERLLHERTWLWVSRLGPGAFETISGQVVKAALVVFSNNRPDADHIIRGLDVDTAKTAIDKAIWLRDHPVITAKQSQQTRNPDARVILTAIESGPLLERNVDSFQGMKTGDDPRYRRFFWEVPKVEGRWRRYQSTVPHTCPFGGLEYILDWSQRGHDMARLQGISAWGKPGVAVSQMSGLAVSFYMREPFDSNMSALIPKDPAHLPAVWAYLQSPEYREAVNAIDRSLKVTNSALVKVPFDLARWQSVAERAESLPEPRSDDTTQWIFAGHPRGSTAPLQVAAARLLGYRWPNQRPDSLDSYADADGLVCLPALAGEPPAAESLRALLTAAYGTGWSVSTQEELLAEVGYAGKSLDTWLREGFFEQHCRVFQSRPFVWQIWDGRPDGFSAIVNYHRLDGALLDKLTYTYLGSWIEQQRSAAERREAAAEGRLVAALELQRKLALLRQGEPPYDIYVRWKPLHKQAIGWEPDLDDGVRLNIRPLVQAGVLRRKFTINWNTDKGGEIERVNDAHSSLEERRRARTVAGAVV